eukprot:COSAG02_NODE_5870_length_3974_cov_5.840774_2_plen_207_part_00
MQSWPALLRGGFVSSVVRQREQPQTGLLRAHTHTHRAAVGEAAYRNREGSSQGSSYTGGGRGGGRWRQQQQQRQHRFRDFDASQARSLPPLPLPQQQPHRRNQPPIEHPPANTSTLPRPATSIVAPSAAAYLRRACPPPASPSSRPSFAPREERINNSYSPGTEAGCQRKTCKISQTNAKFNVYIYLTVILSKIEVNCKIQPEFRP